MFAYTIIMHLNITIKLLLPENIYIFSLPHEEPPFVHGRTNGFKLFNKFIL